MSTTEAEPAAAPAEEAPVAEEKPAEAEEEQKMGKWHTLAYFWTVVGLPQLHWMK